MFKILCVCLTVLVCSELSLAHSKSSADRVASRRIGNEGGGGGGAVRIDGRLYLLDLVEAGVEKSPYINMSLTPDAQFLARLRRAMPAEFPTELIARKLTEIAMENRVMSLILLQTIENYQWKIVNAPLKRIYDDHTHLLLREDQYKQLAIRKGSSVSVYRSIWKDLDLFNRVVLVFHEVLYALDQPRFAGFEVVRGFQARYQLSEYARELNGYLFSELPRLGAERMQKFSAFNHITAFPNTVTQTGIYEQSGIVSFAPITFFVVWSKDKSTYNEAKLDPTTTDHELNERIARVCAYAAAEKSPVEVSRHPETKVYVRNSFIYMSLSSKTEYTEVHSPIPLSDKKVTGIFGSESECVRALNQEFAFDLSEMRQYIR